MSLEFFVPVHLEDLELAKIDRRSVQEVQPLEQLSSDEAIRVLQGLEDEIQHGIRMLLQQEVFDTLYSFIKKFKDLSERVQVQTLQTSCSILNQVVHTIKEHTKHSSKNTNTSSPEDIQDLRSIFKCIVYMVCQLVLKIVEVEQAIQKEINLHQNRQQKKNHLKSMFSWSKYIENALNQLDKSIHSSTFGLWKMNLPEEEFVLGYCKVVYGILEKTSLMKLKPMKKKLIHLLALCLEKVQMIHVSIVTSLMDLVYANEHLATSIIAEMIFALQMDYPNTITMSRISIDIMNEIGKIASRNGSKDLTCIRNASNFLTSFSSLLPGVILANLSLILPLLDAEAYQLRNAAVSCIGQVLLSNFEEIQKQQIEEECKEKNKEEITGSTKKKNTRRKNYKEDKDDHEEGEEEDEEEEEEMEEEEDDKDDEDDEANQSDDELDEEKHNKKDNSKKNMSSSTRDRLFSLLEERIHDINSFARAHVLRIWQNLCEQGALPVSKLASVTRVGIDRLHDKAAIVRKCSLQLLTLLIERNPFMGNLDKDFYLQKKEEMTLTFKKKQQYLIQQAEKQVNKGLEDIQLHENISFYQEDIFQNEEKEEEEFLKLKKILHFYTEAIDFIEEFEKNALPFCIQLLGSKYTSDVMESINFFEKAIRFQLPNASSKGIKKMLLLIWRSDILIQEEVLRAFQAIFFYENKEKNIFLPSKLIVENLIHLLDTSSVSEMTCIEKIMMDLYKKQEIPLTIVNSLWDFIEEITTTTPPKKQIIPYNMVANAISLLGMIAKEDEMILFGEERERLEILLQVGFCLNFSEETQATQQKQSIGICQVLSASCNLLQRLQILDPKPSTSTSSKRSNSLRVMTSKTNVQAIEKIVSHIETILALDQKKWFKVGVTTCSSTWFDACQQAIEALFVLCDHPEEVIGQVIKRLSNTTFYPITSSLNSTQGSTIKKNRKNPKTTVFQLAHFFFVLGHVAVRMAIHVEKLAFQLKKLRANQGQKLLCVKKNKKKNTNENEDKNQEEDHTNTDGASAMEDVSAMEEELGMAAEIEAEEESFVHDIIQKELVCKNLLGAYGPLIIKVVLDQSNSQEDERVLDGMQENAMLSQCAIVALCKFMAVSGEFCEKHLALLFTTLQESRRPDVRANLVIALGDLSFRFPNLIEPWTSHIYARLRDVDVQVRKNTMLVLSHLILNDMIKVKGQISEIAISIVDEDETIRNSARLFFHELSLRGNNPIYNLLPDAIGRLSLTETLEQKDFESICKLLVSFISKEKQIESIVEKLSQRLSNCPSASEGGAKQQRDLAFCLSLLPHTEKSLRFIVLHRKFFMDALHDEVVQTHFQQIIQKSKRGTGTSMTNEMKEVLEQLTVILQRIRDGHEEEVEDTMLPPQFTMSTKKAKKPATATKNTASKAQEKRTTRSKTTNSKKTRKTLHYESGSESSDTD